MRKAGACRVQRCGKLVAAVRDYLQDIDGSRKPGSDGSSLFLPIPLDLNYLPPMANTSAFVTSEWHYDAARLI
jgi:hypothetical protein